MIYPIFFFLIFIIKFSFSNKESIARILYLFFSVISFLSLFHLESNINDFNFLNSINFIFIIICLIIIIDSFKNHVKVDEIYCKEFNLFQKNVILILSCLGTLALLINLYLVYKIYSFHSISEITIDVLKNENGADDYFKANEPRSIRTFSHIFSPFGYFFLVLHFMFISRKNFKKSFFFLLLSLSIPLHGMQGLSRAAPSQYVLVYFFMYYYLSNSFDNKINQIFKRIMLVAMIFLLTYFIYTSYSRFSEAFYYINKLGGDSNIFFLITYSFIDYLTQWVPYGIDSLSFYRLDIDFTFSNFRPLFDYITSFLGIATKADPDHFVKIYGHYSSRFIGLIPTLVFDSGYIITFLLVLLFRFLAYKKTKNRIVNFYRLLKIPLLLSLILMSFANAWLAYLLFHLAIIYIVILTKLFYSDISSKSNFII
jgi:hypothetical protein